VVTVDREQIEPADRAGWRAWLADNAASSPSAWVVIHRKADGPLRLTYNDAVEEALCFGWIDSTLRRLDDRRGALLFAPRRPGGTWALTNKARVARLTEQGLMTDAGQHAVERARSDGSWSMLDDIEALRVPPDLAAALAAAGAQNGFDTQSASKRKSALWWIASARRPETRDRRIAETVQHAAERTADRPPTGAR